MVLICLVVLFGKGFNIRQAELLELKNQAVSRNYAEFVTDGEKISFVWKIIATQTAEVSK